MRKVFLMCLLVVVLCLSGCDLFLKKGVDENRYLQGDLLSLSEDGSASDIAAVVGDAVVGIGGVMTNGESIGSGVCVSPDGHILTNSHVVSDTISIKLYLSNGEAKTAKVIYDNPVLDLAILKSSVPIPYLKVGNSDELLVGGDVLAVGTPLSLTLTHTFTKGIVSALNRTIKVGSTSGEGYMQNLIQHDASLNPGNSGGPLLNLKGEVVGINTLKISGGEGIGFAIPSKSFSSLLESFVDNINFEVPYLGVYGYDAEIEKYYGNVERDNGFYVLSVSNSSPLAECGVERGCVITSINGQEIDDTLDLKNELYKFSSADTVFVEFEKDGLKYNVKTKLRAK